MSHATGSPTPEVVESLPVSAINEGVGMSVMAAAGAAPGVAPVPTTGRLREALTAGVARRDEHLTESLSGSPLGRGLVSRCRCRGRRKSPPSTVPLFTLDRGLPRPEEAGTTAPSRDQGVVMLNAHPDLRPR